MTAPDQLATLRHYSHINGLAEHITKSLEEAVGNVASDELDNAVIALHDLADSADGIIDNARALALACGATEEEAIARGDTSLALFLAGKRLDTEVAAELEGKAFEHAVVEVAHALTDDEDRREALIGVVALASTSRLQESDALGDLRAYALACRIRLVERVVERLFELVALSGRRIGPELGIEGRVVLDRLLEAQTDFLKASARDRIASAQAHARKLIDAAIAGNLEEPIA